MTAKHRTLDATSSARWTEKPPVVILSSIKWDFLWQRHQILATMFASSGRRVVFVEGLSGSFNYLSPEYYGRIPGKFTRILKSFSNRRMANEASDTRNPRSTRNGRVDRLEALVVPLEPKILRTLNGSYLAPRIAREIRDKLDGERPVVWNFQPTTTTLQITDALDPLLSVYDCVMNFRAMDWMPEDVADTEREWVEYADLVVTDSAFLAGRHSRVRDDVVQVPPGVDFDLFSRVHDPEDDPGSDVRNVSFFGGMGDGWFDFDLVEGIADAGFGVHLIGNLQGTHRLLSHENVAHLPPVPQRDLPSLLESTDALILPYRLNDFTKGVFPSKAYECLATGKPVVATPLPDLRRSLMDDLYFADNAEEFVQTLKNLPNHESEATVAARMQTAKRNSWSRRFEDIEQHLDEKLREKSR